MTEKLLTRTLNLNTNATESFYNDLIDKALKNTYALLQMETVLDIGYHHFCAYYISTTSKVGDFDYN